MSSIFIYVNVYGKMFPENQTFFELQHFKNAKISHETAVFLYKLNFIYSELYVPLRFTEQGKIKRRQT